MYVTFYPSRLESFSKWMSAIELRSENVNSYLHSLLIRQFLEDGQTIHACIQNQPFIYDNILLSLCHFLLCSLLKKLQNILRTFLWFFVFLSHFVLVLGLFHVTVIFSLIRPGDVWKIKKGRKPIIANMVCWAHGSHKSFLILIFNLFNIFNWAVRREKATECIAYPPGNTTYKYKIIHIWHQK